MPEANHASDCCACRKERDKLFEALTIAYEALSEGKGFLQSTTAIEIRAVIAMTEGKS